MGRWDVGCQAPLWFGLIRLLPAWKTMVSFLEAKKNLKTDRWREGWMDEKMWPLLKHCRQPRWIGSGPAWSHARIYDLQRKDDTHTHTLTHTHKMLIVTGKHMLVQTWVHTNLHKDFCTRMHTDECKSMYTCWRNTQWGENIISTRMCNGPQQLCNCYSKLKCPLYSCLRVWMVNGLHWCLTHTNVHRPTATELPCKALACSLIAIWGSVSCSSTRGWTTKP